MSVLKHSTSVPTVDLTDLTVTSAIPAEQPTPGHADPGRGRAISGGLIAAFASPLFLGFAPIFGKLAILNGSDPFTVAALRTVIAAGILWIIYLCFFRRYLTIYPAGLLACIVIGTINGIGSLFYYNGLGLLDASLAQMLNATYLIFVVIMVRFGGQRLNRRTIVRTLIALVAVILLTGGGVRGQFSWLGVGLMLANAIMFAGTVFLSGRVLHEMPPPTVTIYVLSTMAIVVVMARFGYRLEWTPQSPQAFTWIIALAITTALARLSMFTGIKILGSLQTVLVGIIETGFALILAVVVLSESLSAIQYVGVALLFGSLLLIRPSDLSRPRVRRVPMFEVAGIVGFQKVAFNQAFGRDPRTKLTDDELQKIRRMLEAPPHED